MKLWRFFGYIGASFVVIASACGGVAYLFAGPDTVGYFYIVALVFTVMAIHATIYAEWQFLRHHEKEAVFLKRSQNRRYTSGAT